MTGDASSLDRAESSTQFTHRPNIPTHRSKETKPMPKPKNESTITRTPADRFAIERWEGEGGRALAAEGIPHQTAGPSRRSERGDLDFFEPRTLGQSNARRSS